MVAALLRAHDLAPHFSAGYVSSDHALLKRTGNLFDFVCKQEGIAPQELLHVGDNPESDGEAAAKKGVQAWVIRDGNALRRAKRLAFDFEEQRRQRSWGGYAAAAFAQALPGERASREEAYSRRVVAPIIASFLHKLAERCKEERIEAVYFLAREGLILKDSFEKIAPVVYGSETPPPSIYLGVSRLTALAYASARYGLRDLMLALLNGPPTIRNLMAPLQLSEADMVRLATDYQLPPIDHYLPYFYLHWPPFLRFLQDAELIAAAERRHRDVGAPLGEYLEQVGFFSAQRVAVVDLGWSGQIQESLYLGAKAHADCPQIFGFYLGLNASAHQRKSRANWMEAAISDTNFLDWNGSVAFQFPQSLEAIVRAPHGTVVGYEKDADGIVQPVPKSADSGSRKAELENEVLIALFQRGIERYISLYADAAAILGLHADDTIPYAREMIQRMLRFPHGTEALWLLGLKNVSDLGSDSVYQMGDTDRRAPVWDWRAVKRAADASFWKYGTLALYGGRPLQAAWAIYTDARAVPVTGAPLAIGVTADAPGFQPKKSRSSNRSASTALHPRGGTRTFETWAIQRARHLASWTDDVRPLVPIEPLTQPMSWTESVVSKAVYRGASLYTKLNKRQPLWQSGVSVKPLFTRALHGSPFGETILAFGKRVFSLGKRKHT